VPTIDDVLHARIQTIGVAEHAFVVQHNNRTVQWRLYDVGGARGQRHSWAPFFDDANAIIYVAPISAYDQVGGLSYPVDGLSHRLFLSLLVPGRRPSNK